MRYVVDLPSPISCSPLRKLSSRSTVNELGLHFPVGYNLPLKEAASILGAFYEERRGVLHATGFVLKPDHTIAVAQYSSGPIGRLVWQDVLALVQFQKKQAR
jgi:hypothetical protein